MNSNQANLSKHVESPHEKDDAATRIATLEACVAQMQAELAAARALAAESETKLEMITGNMPALISFIDKNEVYQFNNKTYEEWFNKPRAEIYGKRISEVMGPARYEIIKPHIKRALSGEKVRFEMKLSGENRYAEALYIPHVIEEEVHGFYVMAFDISLRKQQEAFYEHHAMHDSLTGLPNRRACMERLSEAIARVSRNVKPLAVMFLDLDKFKKINDTFGHEIGDRVLVVFAERIKQCVRKTDVVARLAGDEFVIVAEGLTHPNDVNTVAKKILRVVAETMQIDGVTIHPTTSIGIALHGGGAVTPTQLLNFADEAMYRAKRMGSNTYYISEL